VTFDDAGDSACAIAGEAARRTPLVRPTAMFLAIAALIPHDMKNIPLTLTRFARQAGRLL
jgi:hypothetical protein